MLTRAVIIILNRAEEANVATLYSNESFNENLGKMLNTVNYVCTVMYVIHKVLVTVLLMLRLYFKSVYYIKYSIV